MRDAEDKAQELRPKLHEVAQALQDQDQVRRQIEVRRFFGGVEAWGVWVMFVFGVYVCVDWSIPCLRMSLTQQTQTKPNSNRTT